MFVSKTRNIFQELRNRALVSNTSTLTQAYRALRRKIGGSLKNLSSKRVINGFDPQLAPNLVSGNHRGITIEARFPILCSIGNGTVDTSPSKEINTSSSLPAEINTALDKILEKPQYLRGHDGAYVHGLAIQARICDKLIHFGERKFMQLVFFLEQFDKGRAVPLSDLQRQAQEYLQNNAKYFPDLGTLAREYEVSPDLSSLARGTFRGRTAYNELMLLLDKLEETGRNQDKPILTEEGLAKMFFDTALDSFIFEIKAHAAVALTCFGSSEVVDKLFELSTLEGNLVEYARSVAQDALNALAHFSPLALGIIYHNEKDVPEELKEHYEKLRYCGHALELAKEIDRFCYAPENRGLFFENTTPSLSKSAASFMETLLRRDGE